MDPVSDTLIFGNNCQKNCIPKIWNKKFTSRMILFKYQQIFFLKLFISSRTYSRYAFYLILKFVKSLNIGYFTKKFQIFHSSNKKVHIFSDSSSNRDDGYALRFYYNVNNREQIADKDDKNLSTASPGQPRTKKVHGNTQSVIITYQVWILNMQKRMTQGHYSKSKKRSSNNIVTRFIGLNTCEIWKNTEMRLEGIMKYSKHEKF